MYYNQFKSVVSYQTSELPIFSQGAVDSAEKISLYDSLDADVLQSYMEYSLASMIYYCLKEGACSEQSSRMSAMDNSSKNAGNLSYQFFNSTQFRSIYKTITNCTHCDYDMRWMLNVNNYPWASSSIDIFCVFCRWNDWQVDPDLQQNQASCHYWRTHWDHLRSCRFVSTNQDLFKTNFLKTLFLCFAIFETRNACVIIYVSEFHQGTKLENGQVWKALSYKRSRGWSC